MHNRELQEVLNKANENVLDCCWIDELSSSTFHSFFYLLCPDKKTKKYWELFKVDEGQSQQFVELSNQ